MSTAISTPNGFIRTVCEKESMNVKTIVIAKDKSVHNGHKKIYLVK